MFFSNYRPRYSPISIILTILLAHYLVSGFTNATDRQVQVKLLGFSDPNTGYIYRVISYNVTSMTTQSTFRSEIKVSRVRSNEPWLEAESVQTIGFHPTLVDFDLHCELKHCFLVAVTGRTNRNIELYSWRRTQFDLQVRRDSFARPSAVKLFKIYSGFYIVIAQEQLHLTPHRLAQDYEEPARLIGNVVLKFHLGHEKDLKYHQFIKLPYNPLYVNHFISQPSQNLTSSPALRKPGPSYYLVFSTVANWLEPGSPQASSYQWSPLNDLFWPYRLPRGVQINSGPGIARPTLRFPGELPSLAQTVGVPQSGSEIVLEPVESCFNQLQRLLNDRDIYGHRLIETSKTLWRTAPHSAGGLTNISAQVIVRGNVIVRGSMLESPQILLVGQPQAQTIENERLASMIIAHSPAIVDNKFRAATYKLNDIRNKLSRAVSANPLPVGEIHFGSRVRFFGNILANRVIFRRSQVVNSNVRLNGIPFRQLEHELVSLRGAQDIGSKVKFTGNVVADLLEIHGTINGLHRLLEAVDIKSKHVQVIDTIGSVQRPIEFYSAEAPEITFSPEATINDIKLDEFITKDNRTQFINGRKSFRYLSMAKLTLANQHVLLNDVNISRLASKAIRLRDLTKTHQVMNGDYATFSAGITVDRLSINNLINNHINMSTLIHDTVKVNDISPQQIFGMKTFQGGLKIAHLTTEGAINGVKIDRILSPSPLELANYSPPARSNYQALNSSNLQRRELISGRFKFVAPVTIGGNLYANQVNGIDLSARTVRRTPMPQFSDDGNKFMAPNQPQLINGHKIFVKPLRILDRIRLLQSKQLMQYNLTNQIYPLINGLDIRLIQAGLSRLIQNPPLISIENLEIEGNLHLRTSPSEQAARATLGNYSQCPLDLIRSRLVLVGSEDQTIDVPIRIDSIRSRAVQLDPGSLNGLAFPQDFVLRSSMPASQNEPNMIEPVFGHKTFEQLVIPSPSPINAAGNRYGQSLSSQPGDDRFSSSPNVRGKIVLGHLGTVNNISFVEMKAFVERERQQNSTGETVLQTLDVYGEIRAKRINGFNWPDDILLKSASASRGPLGPAHLHRRIYSPLIFPNSSHLRVESQLVLRGPIQLEGRLNGVNLTEFARQSITYGDKDLLSIGRPIRNKFFMGGLTVTGEVRAQGLIDGVNFDEMRRRVVTIGPNRQRTPILSPKTFLSDTIFQSPVNMIYLNDLPIDHHLKQIRVQPQDDRIRIFGKKTITGTLRINKDLIVQGLINKIDFVDLKAKAISTNDEVKFNKTLTIEGNVFMDNLLIDERDGIIDGIKLVNLLPINADSPSFAGARAKNEITFLDPYISRPNSSLSGPNQHHHVNIGGVVNDCQITCSVAPAPQTRRPLEAPTNQYRQPVPYVPQSLLAYPPRPIQYNGRNLTYMRTTPPYASDYHPQLPILVPHQHHQQQQPVHMMQSIVPDQKRIIRSLVSRQPISIQYELPRSTKRDLNMHPGRSPLISEQLNALRHQILSLPIIKLSAYSSDLVIGFIEAPPQMNHIASLLLPEEDEPHSDHVISPKSFLQLDQIDFPFRPTIYHLSVGVTTGYAAGNITSVLSSLGGSQLQQLSVLPVESPNTAMFLKIVDQQSLFLLISEDYTTYAKNNAVPQCPRSGHPTQPMSSLSYGQQQPSIGEHRAIMGGIHVYLFHALQNSSSLNSAYFDLFQTIDLPAVDNFQNFNYKGSTYVLAINRSLGRVHVLLLRGFSGFQVVSYFEAPMIESIRIAYTLNQRPTLIIYQTDGFHKIMDSVII